MLELDHLAVSAATLEEGRAAVENALGVTVQPGGQHAHFVTHNLLLGLEDGLYLEVIATDPSPPKPSYPRWFDLDRFKGAPRLSNWICRTGDLTGMVKRLPQAGAPVALQRGDLRWRMAVPPDGALPNDNRFPALMQWDVAAHPANLLKASGCRMTRLVVSHPEAQGLSDLLSPFLQDARVAYEAGPSGLRAEFETPMGRRVLE